MVHTLDYDKVNKIITIPSPDTEITIQNLLNDIRDFEDELSSMDIPFICSAAGKEALGGGVSVGLTLTLLDGWKVAFEARPGPTYVQCTVSGGNLVSSDETNPISPTAFTQVVVTASSSATTADLDAIQYSSYGGVITVDVINGQSGTAYPIGNREFPVDNFVDARTIGLEKGINVIHIKGDATLDTGDNLSTFIIEGESDIHTALTINPGADVMNCIFRNLEISGTLDGGNKLEHCEIGTINYYNGSMEFCSIGNATITLGGGAQANIINCVSSVAGEGTPTINMGGSGQKLTMRGYRGGIMLTNKTGTDVCSIDLDGGQLRLDPDGATGVVDGEFRVSGNGKIVNHDTDAFLDAGEVTFNSATIKNETSNPITNAQQTWDWQTSLSQDVGSTGKAITDAGSAGNPWSALLTDNNDPGTFGWLVQKLLTVAKFLGLK